MEARLAIMREEIRKVQVILDRGEQEWNRRAEGLPSKRSPKKKKKKKKKKHRPMADAIWTSGREKAVLTRFQLPRPGEKTLVQWGHISLEKKVTIFGSALSG